MGLSTRTSNFWSFASFSVLHPLSVRKSFFREGINAIKSVCPANLFVVVCIFLHFLHRYLNLPRGKNNKMVRKRPSFMAKRPSYANMNNSAAQSLVNHVNSDVVSSIMSHQKLRRQLPSSIIYMVITYSGASSFMSRSG